MSMSMSENWWMDGRGRWKGNNQGRVATQPESLATNQPRLSMRTFYPLWNEIWLLWIDGPLTLIPWDAFILFFQFITIVFEPVCEGIVLDRWENQVNVFIIFFNHSDSWSTSAPLKPLALLKKISFHMECYHKVRKNENSFKKCIINYRAYMLFFF